MSHTCSCTQEISHCHTKTHIIHCCFHSCQHTQSTLRLPKAVLHRGLPLHQAVKGVFKVSCMIILCIICFALSLVAPISIWILCLVFFPNTQANPCSKFCLTVFGFSSHVYLYFFGSLHEAFQLSFGLSGTIFYHIYRRSEKITFPKGGAVRYFLHPYCLITYLPAN